jgi:hypothetical protein
MASSNYMSMDLTIPNPPKGRVVGYENKRINTIKSLALGLPSIKQSYSLEQEKKIEIKMNNPKH